MWCLSNVVRGHRKTPKACLWDIVIKTQASSDARKRPLQATERRPAACWSAVEKIAGVEGIYFVLYFKGLLWPEGRAGCSWSAPSPSWCRAEPGGPSRALRPPGMARCSALGTAFGGTVPNPPTAPPARQGTGGSHPQPSSPPPNSSQLKQLSNPLLKCVSRVLSCMNLKLGLASQGGRTLTKSCVNTWCVRGTC